MSQQRSHKDTNLPLPDSGSRPSFGQSSSPSFASVPQSVLSQRLIPRDYLGLRSKPSSESASTSEISKPAQPAADPVGSNKYKLSDQRDGNSVHVRNGTATQSGKATPESDTSTNYDPRAARTKSPESLDSPPGPNLSRTGLSSVASNAGTPKRVIMPRNSSIDSAISSVSTTSLHRAGVDAREPSPGTVRNLIATAGGAESLVVHLLKDKNSIASQNAQLWKLVDKQRALLLGLNKDLERITKERDKYKKRVKDLHPHTTDDGRHKAPTEQPAREVHKSGNIFGDMNESAKLNGLALYSEDFVSGISPRSNQHEHAESLEHTGHNTEHVAAGQSLGTTVPEVLLDVTHSPPTDLKLNTSAAPPVFNIIEASPMIEKSSKSLPSNRKAPPKPLNLIHGKTDGASQNNIPAGDENANAETELERGRRRTREDDDRERELSALKAEAEARSRSKKDKTPLSVASEEPQAPAPPSIPAPLPTPGLPLSPRPQHAQAFVAPQGNLAAVTGSTPASLGERLLTAPLMSPGLPLSPRPINRGDTSTVANSLPLSPRANMGTFPLSPRAPKHALPVPTNPGAPTDVAALQKSSKTPQASPLIPASATVDRLQVHQPMTSEPPPVYRGLAISAYPNLLLPPNALPSIQVRVHSSRLRPSRHSVLGLKSQEDTTIFSLSVISRSSNSELWRLEKLPGTLPQLEQQLRPRCVDLPTMPDRRLFSGQSPVMLDERRKAIDTYFDELLDIHVDEQAAITICRYLSTDVVEVEQSNKTANSGSNDAHLRMGSLEKPTTKTGFLTKKGKNFGGWKSRFFVLDGPELRYFESSGGQHLGTIRLQGALIGKQKDNDVAEDADGQYRHAFLIQESKRKDSGMYVRHVLCAESDAERDEWVRILLHWVEGATPGTSKRIDQSPLIGHGSADTAAQYPGARSGNTSRDGASVVKDTHHNTPTPTSISSVDSSILDQPGPIKPATISGPMNGGVITDSSTWGQRPVPPTTQKEVKDKTHKMGNIFGFRKPDPPVTQQEQKPVKPRILRHNGYVRPVFGLPVADAVEYCAPFNVDVELPAVVYRCLEYLRYRNAANEEGLFRLSGSNVVVRTLKERFNTEGDVDLAHEDDYHDVHAVASLFKTYLRELPSTLLTRDLHIEFIKVLELESNSDKVVAFNTLVRRLPRANFCLLKEMSSYLLEVASNSDRNKMSVRNIGIVFSPTLNIPTPVFTLFLTEYAAIFESELSKGSDIRSTEVKAPQDLTPDEIRSPRHQMFSDLPTPAYNQTSFQNQASMVPPRGTMTGTGELGFMPIQPAYESANYVSMPRNATAHAPQPLTQVPDAGGYGSLNGLLAPSNPASEKAKRRESAILFTH